MRRVVSLAGCSLLLLLFMGSTRADAQAVRFRFVGGHWSHNWHHGWHRYWGGPAIGFYYAPTPVYVVRGYPGPSYYVGPDFWYSNPSFGLNINIGGGGGGRWHGGHPVIVHEGNWHGGGRGVVVLHEGRYGGHGGGRGYAMHEGRSGGHGGEHGGRHDH